MEKKDLLRALPKIDDILRLPVLAEADLPLPVLTDLVRAYIDSLREGILQEKVTALPEKDELCRQILAQAKEKSLPSLRQVINATGVTLHTNLGRSCLSEAAAKAAYEAARRYSTLEYDIEAGARGSRYSHVEELLCRITGAESALVVNNNAAAVLLILSCMAQGGEVITSRGELVEIGGSFRIPEIVQQCGSRLKEVGATNKTHLRDYENAIGEETRALLKVHTSNFRIMGFSQSVPLADLVALGKKAGLPVIEDLGSGCLVDLEPLGIHDEPTVMQSVKAGVDVISFSGDKLLGGPQAGIIIGKKFWIDKLKKHPLNRAVRVDKMTLAALEATLRIYLDPAEAVKEIPTLRMILEEESVLKEKAQKLCDKLAEKQVPVSLLQDVDQVGGGSVPCQFLPAWAAAVAPENCSVDQLEERLRKLPRPIIGRISHDRYLLDVRALWEEDFSYIAEKVGEAVG